jgi:hypothetical protein
MKSISTKKGAKGRTVAAIAIVATVAGVLLCFGIAAAYGALKRTYELQCCVTNVGEQVEIVAGKTIPARVIISHFGLTNSVNLAHVPFAELRLRLIRDMANLKDVKIVRTMPNKVRIEAIERVPVVRVTGSGANANPNYAADSEGMVFWYPRRDTALLPAIRHSGKNTPAPGTRLSGMALCALQLFEEAANPDYSILKIQEADTFKQDYLFLTLGDSSRAKIAWEDMGNDSKIARESLRRQLKRLSQAMQSNVANGTKLWNATDWGVPGRIYANDPTKVDN